MEEGRSVLKTLTGKPTRKRPLGRPKRKWEDYIRMDLEEVGISAGNWVDSAQDRNYWRALVNTALNLQVPIVRTGRCLIFLSFSFFPSFFS